MPEEYKVLAQVTAPAATGSGSTGTVLYQVPDSTAAIVKYIAFKPYASLACSITSVTVEQQNPQAVMGAIPLAAGEWAEWDGSLALDQYAALRVYVSKGDDCWITVSGLEITP